MTVALSILPLNLAAAQNSAIVAGILGFLLDDTPSYLPKVLGHWRLDENSGQIAQDSSDYGRNGHVQCHEQVTCLPNWVAGKNLGALGFNGQTDYVSLPHQSINGQGDISLSLWFKTAVSGRQQTLLSGAEQFNSNSSRIMISSSGRLRYYTGSRSWEYQSWPIPSVADNQWHQVVIVRNDRQNQVTLYLDGYSYGTQRKSLDTLRVDPETLIVGLETDWHWSGRISFDSDESFVGQIDDIKFIRGVLPRKEVELAYLNRNWDHLSILIDRGSDDAETSSNPSYPSLSSGDLDFHEHGVGLRFNKTGIPKGATIERAYVEFRSGSSSSTSIDIPVHGELIADAHTFGDSLYPFDSRTRTSANINWTPQAWSWWELHRTPDLSPIIQEIINQPAWKMGNSLALLFEKGNNSDRRSALAFDYDPDLAPRLIVYYSGGTPDASPPSVPTGLQASPTSTAIELSWQHADDAQSGIAHYTLYRKLGTATAQPIMRLEKTSLSPWYTDSDVVPGTPYTYTVTATNYADIESAHSSPLTAVPRLVSAASAHWPLDETSGTAVNDIGPAHQHGQINHPDGPGRSAAGKNGGALVFDAVDDRIDLPHTALNGAKDVTVSLWFKTSKASAQTLISGANRYHHDAFRIYFANANRLDFHANADSASWDIEAIDDDQWHHLLITINNQLNGIALYMDGVFQGGRVLTLDPVMIEPNGLVVGQDQDSIGGGFELYQAFAGMIDDIRIEQRVLNWIEIQNQIIMDPTPPTNPTGLSASTGDGSMVKLSWNPSSDAEAGICKYRVYRGTSVGNESFLFEVGNITQVSDHLTAENTFYSYRISAENCVAMEGGLSTAATITSGSDANLGLETISAAAWNQNAVRKVLDVFAYGGHAGDSQIAAWASMAPQAAIAEILTFEKTNPQLSPPEDANTAHAESLLSLQQFWGSDANDNPMRWDKRPGYHPLYFNSSGSSSVSYSNLERAWSQAIATRGLNPFLHKMAFFLSNYQMSISEFKTEPALIRHYYDTLLDALGNYSSFVDVINLGAKHAAVAKAYDHDDNIFYNSILEFEGNDDFAREYFQLFFRIQGEAEDPDYHEGVSIEHNARLLTGMKLDRQENAFDSDNSRDWDIAPIKFHDHIDSAGTYRYNQSNHHANCLEILHQIICGATSSEKLDALSPIAANHIESLANLPLYIVNLFADDNLSPLKEQAIQAQWRASDFNLLTFLRAYAISTAFHSSDTFKYLSSFDRTAMLFNKITLDNQETFVGLDMYEDAEYWLDYIEIDPFNPIHDVFGHQTGLEATHNPSIFMRSFQFAIDRNTLQKTEEIYFDDESKTTSSAWYKDWGSVAPDNGSGSYVVSQVAEWLWKRLTGDGGKNFDIIARSQVYALLARGDDFGYVAFQQGAAADRTHAFTSLELGSDPALAGLLASLGAETIALGSNDIPGTRETANARVGQAVQFIAMLPYTFIVEGQ